MNILLQLLYIIHVITFSCMFVGPLLVTSTEALICIILLNVVIVTQWYIFDDCLLTPIENNIGGEEFKYESGINKSFITVFFQNTFGMNDKVAFYFLSSIPLLSTIICLIKILYNK